jgi:hypothetical protein
MSEYDADDVTPDQIIGHFNAMKARIKQLEDALRKCAAELHNYHSIAGDEALDAAHEALTARTSKGGE